MTEIKHWFKCWFCSYAKLTTSGGMNRHCHVKHNSINTFDIMERLEK